LLLTIFSQNEIFGNYKISGLPPFINSENSSILKIPIQTISSIAVLLSWSKNQLYSNLGMFFGSLKIIEYVFSNH